MKTISLLRRQVFFLLVTEILWGAGTYFILPTTTLPSYLKALHASPTLIGVMVSVVIALPLIPQLFGRSILERYRRRKRGLILLHIILLAAFPLAAAVDYFFHTANPALLLGMFLVLLSISQIMLGIVTPLWLDMIAQVIPLRVRGRYFGFSSAGFAVGGMLGASGLIALQAWLGDAVYRGAFITTGCLYLLSMTAFAFAPIPESAFGHPPGPSILQRVRESLPACRLSSSFGRLIASYAGQTFALCLTPFLIQYVTDAHGLGMPADIFGKMTLWQAMGAAMGALVLGLWVDRRGPRRPWMMVTLCVPIVIALYVSNFSAMPVVVVCSMLVGVLGSHWSVGAPALLEYSPRGDKSSFIALANLASFAPATLGPFIIAQAIGLSGYPAAFLLTLFFSAIAFGFAVSLRERGGDSAMS